MVYRVVFTRRSERDQARIYRYIRRDNAETATSFMSGRAEKANSLATFPHQGGRLDGQQRLRFLVAARYLIIYRIVEDRREVHILNFWHSARAQRQFRGDYKISG